MATKVHTSCRTCGKEFIARTQDLSCKDCIASRYHEVWSRSLNLPRSTEARGMFRDVLDEEIIF